MFERKEDLEELRKAQGGVVEVIVTKQVTFRTKAYLCFDLDRRETFVATEEQWRAAEINLQKQLEFAQLTGLFIPPVFYIETETGKHFNWVWRPDGDYSKE